MNTKFIEDFYEKYGFYPIAGGDGTEDNPDDNPPADPADNPPADPAADPNPNDDPAGDPADPAVDPRDAEIAQLRQREAALLATVQNLSVPKNDKDPTAEDETVQKLARFTDDQLIELKNTEQYKQHAVTIDKELHRRNRVYAETVANNSINRTINQIGAANLHKDFKDPNSKLSKTFARIYNEDAPYLQKQQNGAMIAAKSAMGELGLTAQATSGPTDPKIVDKTNDKRKPKPGGGAAPGGSELPDFASMSDEEFEAALLKVKEGAYQ